MGGGGSAGLQHVRLAAAAALCVALTRPPAPSLTHWPTLARPASGRASLSLSSLFSFLFFLCSSGCSGGPDLPVSVSEFSASTT